MQSFSRRQLKVLSWRSSGVYQGAEWAWSLSESIRAKCEGVWAGTGFEVIKMTLMYWAAGYCFGLRWVARHVWCQDDKPSQGCGPWCGLFCSIQIHSKTPYPRHCFAPPSCAFKLLQGGIPVPAAMLPCSSLAFHNSFCRSAAAVLLCC